MKYTKYKGWQWDMMPTELRLNDAKGTVMLRCVAGVFEPPEDVKTLIAKAPQMYEALTEIAKGKGAYNHDALKHASNVIAEMKSLAASALED